MFLTFLDQWSTGCNAKIQFHSECGRLMVDLKADLGTWKADCGLNKASPSRVRRRERRAAKRDFAARSPVEVWTSKSAVNVATKTAPESATSMRAAENAAIKGATESATSMRAAENAAIKAAEEAAANAKAAAEELVAKAASVEVSSKTATKEATAKAATVKMADKAITVEVFSKPAAKEAAATESAVTTAAAEKVEAKAAAAEEESPLRKMYDSDQATTSGMNSQPNLAAAEQKFSEFRARWITRLDKCTDDWGLKTELLDVSWSEAPPNSDYLNLSRYLSFSALNNRLFQKISILYWHFIGILGRLWTW